MLQLETTDPRPATIRLAFRVSDQGDLWGVIESIEKHRRVGVTDSLPPQLGGVAGDRLRLTVLAVDLPSPLLDIPLDERRVMILDDDGVARSPMATRDLELIDANLTRIARTAWRGYQEDGKGAVFLSDTDRDAPYLGDALRYIARRDGHGRWPVEVDRMIDRYDPETGLVMLIGAADYSDVRTYRMRPSPPPPKA